MKYKDWLNIWLENYAKPSTKARTYQRYETFASHVKEKLGDIELTELSPLLLQTFATQLLYSGNKKTGNGLSPNTVNVIVSVMQNSLKTAFTLGLTKEYIGDKIKRPKANEKQVECFSLSEQKQIERAVLSDKRRKMLGVLLCLYTGLRIGELLALEWSDVDLRAKLLTVKKTCYDGKDEQGNYARVIETPKTRTSNRVIPIPKQILPLLNALKKERQSPFVIADGRKIISVRSYQRSFELLLKKEKIHHRGFHALRHTFATRAIECGMDVKTLSELLGHKNTSITLSRYAHSLLEHKIEMMNKLGRLF